MWCIVRRQSRGARLWADGAVPTRDGIRWSGWWQSVMLADWSVMRGSIRSDGRRAQTMTLRPTGSGRSGDGCWPTASIRCLIPGSRKRGNMWWIYAARLLRAMILTDWFLTTISILTAYPRTRVRPTMGCTCRRLRGWVSVTGAGPMCIRQWPTWSVWLPTRSLMSDLASRLRVWPERLTLRAANGARSVSESRLPTGNMARFTPTRLGWCIRERSILCRLRFIGPRRMSRLPMSLCRGGGTCRPTSMARICIRVWRSSASDRGVWPSTVPTFWDR